MGTPGLTPRSVSLPTWLWGAEHGVNEYGVAIGNERVSTVHQARLAKPALIGMDLVRLGLERARSAESAVEIMTELLSVHGQGGIADATHAEAYDSSFLIADAEGAYVLETSGSSFVVAPFPGGTAISNRLGLGTNWTQSSDDLDPGDDFDAYRDQREDTTFADVRLRASDAFLATQRDVGLTPRAMAAHLRDHGHGPWGAPGADGSAVPPPAELGDDLSGISVCMHARDISVTAASLIAVIPSEVGDGAPVRAYVALGSPCVSIYLPAFPATVAGPPLFVPRQLSHEAMWRAVDTLRGCVEANPALIHEVRSVLGPVESELWAEADDIAQRPGLWNRVGESWGERVSDALSICISRYTSPDLG